MPDLCPNIPAQLILEHTTDGIYVVDPDCRILYWNKAAERITGWKAEQVLGRRCRDDILAHVDRHGQELCAPGRCPLHRAMASRQAAGAPQLVWAQTAQGGRAPVMVSASPLFDEQGQVLGGVEVFRDESENLLNMEKARLIQKHALAGDLPREGMRFDVLYRPHDVVGGDYYRVQTLADGRHAFMLADVTGHGVAAALYTMTLRALWQDLAAWLDQPAIFMTRLNQSLERLTLGDSFVTAFMGVADPVSGLFTYASAGHPPALLRDAAGGVRTLDPLDLALGMLPDMEFSQDAACLDPGGLLLLCSDGALEAQSPAGEEYGLERLRGYVAQARPEEPQALLRGAEDDLRRHVESVHMEDDLAFLAITRPRS